MLEIRRADERGYADHGWLRSYHSFSFAEYHDPRHMGFGALRVINEDRVAPQAGFGTHGHRDMEIVSYVISGALAHKDSMGNGSTMQAGDVQRMSAGSGVLHSEFNASATDLVHFLQIWIHPAAAGGTPGYEQRHFAADSKRGRLCCIVAPDGADGALRIGQDARIHAGLFDGDESARLPLAAGRLGYVHVVRGTLRVDGHALAAGDALKLRAEPQVTLEAGNDAEVLVFDLPG